jgi:hypothetical protein
MERLPLQEQVTETAKRTGRRATVAHGGQENQTVEWATPGTKLKAASALWLNACG